MNENGHNPLRWNCRARGECFNRVRRPKIEVFADCFPGRINFGDVDGVVEMNGQFLYLEWKGGNADTLPTGQRIQFERRTTDGRSVVLVVRGNAETMAVSAWGYFRDGTWHGWHEGDLGVVKEFARRWAVHTTKERAA